MRYSFQVCKIVEGQRYSKRLNERQITALLKVTCQRPSDREKDILQVFFVCNTSLVYCFQFYFLLRYCLVCLLVVSFNLWCFYMLANYAFELKKKI